MHPNVLQPRLIRRPLAVIVGLICIAAAICLVFFHPAETPLMHAAALIKQGKAAAALPLLEEISQKYPDDTAVLPYLAQAYLRCDRIGEGRTALDTAMRLRLPAAELVPVLLSYADHYANKGDFEEALKLLNASASYQLTMPMSQELAQSKATLYLNWANSSQRQHKVDQSIQYLESAYKLENLLSEPMKSQIPRRLVETYQELAALAESSHDYASAIKLLEKGLGVSNNAMTRMALANLYSRLGQRQKAIDDYRAVAEIDPNNLEARHRLIELTIESADYASARDWLSDLIDKEKSVENFQLMANVCLKLGNYAGAVRALEDARLLRTNDTALLTQLEEALTDWCALLNKQGKFQEALSVKGHADRIADILQQANKSAEKDAQNQSGDLQGASEWFNPANPPIALYSSRIWLAKGSLTPEGEIEIKNVTGKPVSDLTLTVVFYDNTTRHSAGSVALPVANAGSTPFKAGASRFLYFTCPNIVKADHQLAVIIFWRGRLLKELPVVKSRW